MYTFLVGDTKYENVTVKVLAGMECAANLVEHGEHSIVLLDGDTISHPPHVIPKKYIKLELPFKSYLPYSESLFEQCISEYGKCVIKDFKYSIFSYSVDMKTITCFGFDDDECYVGFIEYLTVKKIFIPSLLVFKKTLSN
jgi:hypothetical protein